MTQTNQSPLPVSASLRPGERSDSASTTKAGEQTQEAIRVEQQRETARSIHQQVVKLQQEQNISYAAAKQAQHTPGPWKLSHEVGDGFSVAHEIAPNCGRLIHVATALSGNQAWHDMSRSEAEANARLIAAAPDLLAACKATQFSFEDIRINGEGYRAALKRFVAAKRLARLAIAKADSSRRNDLPSRSETKAGAETEGRAQ